MPTRASLLRAIPGSLDRLEIGPFFTPLLHGKSTKYFDVLDSQTLRDRAEKLGHPSDGVPDIDYCSPTADPSVVPENLMSS